MKKYIHLYFSLCLAIVVLISCDKISNPKLKAIPIDPTNNTKVRKILVEDYTGHTCGYCPGMREYIDSLIKYHGIRIVPVGIHVGFYPGANAWPTPPLYLSDFRTQIGDDYANLFGIGSVLPRLTINRVGYSSDPNSIQFDSGKLGNNYTLDTILNKPHLANISIMNTYDVPSRHLTCQINTEFLIDTSGTYKIVVLITQDSIIDYQKDDHLANPDISNYVHRNVLRDAITSSFGDSLYSGSIDSSDTFNKSYNYTFPSGDKYRNTLCVPMNCSVVVYVYKMDTYEIIQAETERIK